MWEMKNELRKCFNEMRRLMCFLDSLDEAFDTKYGKRRV